MMESFIFVAVLFRMKMSKSINAFFWKEFEQNWLDVQYNISGREKKFIWPIRNWEPHNFNVKVFIWSIQPHLEFHRCSHNST